MSGTPNIQQRLLAGATTPTGTDIGSILRRLLLFHTVILQSNRLREITGFVQTLGLEQTLTLLASGALRIHCYHQAVAQTGQSNARAQGKPPLPLGSYCITTLQTADQHEYLSQCFQELQGAHPLPTKQHIKLKRAVLSAIEAPPPSISDDTLSQFRADLANSATVFARALQRAAQQTLGTTPLPPLSFSAERLDFEDFHVTTNLQSFGLDARRAHAVVEQAVFAVGRMHLCLAQMKGFTALAGFQEADLPLFEDKLFFLTQTLDPSRQEQRYGRVVNLLRLPELANTDQRVDIEQFLTVRDSAECHAFRAWLSTIDTASDTEIKEQVKSLRARLGTRINQPIGAGVRFIVSNALSLIPGIGVVLGPAAGVLDSFLLNKLLPESPIVTFLSAKYPSLFNDAQN